MPASNRPPKAYDAFVRRFPELGEAWDLSSQAGRAGPLDERSRLLIKLAIAIGAQREGAVHSAVRKARAAGIESDALEQVVALAASTLGFPATVAAYTWIGDVARAKRKR
jgi:alkylhydroperoxidase/carboxymuconolactone decarboxylase family protein YurZ